MLAAYASAPWAMQPQCCCSQRTGNACFAFSEPPGTRWLWMQCKRWCLGESAQAMQVCSPTQILASSLLSVPMGPGSNTCPQAKEASLPGSRQPSSFHPERAHLYGSTGGKWERKGGSSGPRVVPCCAGFPQKRMAVRFCRDLVWPVWHPAQAAFSYR